MKRTVALLLVLILGIAMLVGCGGKDNNSDGNDGGTGEIGEEQTVGNITLLVPVGWHVIPGDAGGLENDNSLFLKKTPNASEYLWINIIGENDISLRHNNNEDITPFTVDGIEWTGKINMVTATAGDTKWLVSTYGFEGFADQTIRAIIGSLKSYTNANPPSESAYPPSESVSPLSGDVS